MRITHHFALLALVSCVVLVNTSSAAWQASSQTSTQPSNTPQRCAPANLKSGYTQDVTFFKTKRQVKVYDTDYDETHQHDPICLSKQNNDAIFWVSGSGKKFKLKVYAQGDPSNCGQHPFKLDPTQDSVDGYYSGPLRDDVVEGCLYNVEFQREGQQPADPHIQITH